jgi:hypothetical protein
MAHISVEHLLFLGALTRSQQQVAALEPCDLVFLGGCAECLCSAK